MRALTWQGNLDVRVTEVPDPRIQEPNDAIIQVTSTAICGSDLHLYGVLGPYLVPGDILGHEAMGVVTEVGREITNLTPGDRVVIPFNISCGHCWMCTRGLYAQCETTQVREHGKGAALFGYTSLYGSVPGGQAQFLRVPQAQFGPVKVPPDGPDERTCSCPTCCPPPIRRLSTPIRPRTARWPCSASDPSGSSRRGSPGTWASSG
jgi:threonine dehydrogenase-like Zn-dependent dehydrogenase